MNPQRRKPGPIRRNYFQTSITLPLTMFERVKTYAASSGMSHTQIYRAALEAYLNENPSPRSPKTEN